MTRALGDERSDEELDAAAGIDSADTLDGTDTLDNTASCADGHCKPPPSLDGTGTLINTYA